MVSDKKITMRQQLSHVQGGAPRLTRRSPENKAALTLSSKRGEIGADFCHLGKFAADSALRTNIEDECCCFLKQLHCPSQS